VVTKIRRNQERGKLTVDDKSSDRDENHNETNRNESDKDVSDQQAPA
jgi:hypothetical protein